MAGFENDVMLAKNMNFDQAAAKPHLGVINAAGKLPIGTGNLFPTPEILGGSIVSPDSSVTVGYSTPNITLQVNATNVHYISITPYIVGQVGDIHAGFTTIQSAINAASGDGASATAPLNVYIKPGTYTENLLIADGINLIGFDPQAIGDFHHNSVIISGTLTSSHANAVSSISNLMILGTDSVPVITVTNGANIYFKGCYVGINNGTLIVTDATGATIQFDRCMVDDLTASSILFDSTTLLGPLTMNCFDNTTVSCNNAPSSTAFSLTLNISYSSFNGDITNTSTNQPMFGNIVHSSFGSSLVESGATAASSFIFEFADLQTLSTFTLLAASSASFIECNTPTNSYTSSTAALSFFMCTNRQVLNLQSNSYTATYYDFIIGMDSSGAIKTVTLPTTPLGPQTEYYVKDTGGAAFTNNITIAGNGKNIDGGASYLLNTNFQSVHLIYNGTQWNKL